MSALYCHASDIVTANATVALSAGSANSAFPLVNLYDLNPAKVFKAAGTSCTITFTYGGTQALQGVALLTHNLPGATVTLTNNGGMSAQPIVIPADAEDGLSVDPFLDLRSVASASGTVWTLTITGASANVAIGEVLLMASVRTLPIQWGVTRGDRIPRKVNRTAFDVDLIYHLGVRTRTLRGEMLPRTTYRTAMLTWWRDALGTRKGFCVIPDSTVSDAIMMRFEDPDLEYVLTFTNRTTLTMALVEVARGPGV